MRLKKGITASALGLTALFALTACTDSAETGASSAPEVNEEASFPEGSTMAELSRQAAGRSKPREISCVT